MTPQPPSDRKMTSLLLFKQTEGFQKLEENILELRPSPLVLGLLVVINVLIPGGSVLSVPVLGLLVVSAVLLTVVVSGGVPETRGKYMRAKNLAISLRLACGH